MELQDVKLTGTKKFGLDLWPVVALAIAGIVLLPVLSVFFVALSGQDSAGIRHTASALPRYFLNSLVLMLGVAVFTAVIGTTTAWLTVMFEFPFRRFLNWLLLIPLAIPAYIGAYALVDFLEYAGPLQTALRQMFGWSSAQDYYFPEIRSRGAAILVIGLSLYPYVFLLARNAFYQQSASATEVARALGCSASGSFFRIALPMARPAIAASLAIVMMETLNDFGTVEYFAVQTLTTGIFTTWLERSDAAGAAQIACAILTLVAILVLVERLGRRHARFHQTSNRQRPVFRQRLSGWKAWISFSVCVLPIVFGFVLPVAVLVGHIDTAGGQWFSVSLWHSAKLTFLTAGAAAAITVLAAIYLTYSLRLTTSWLPKTLAPVTTIGYAAPGAVLGLGILLTFSKADHWVADFWQAVSGTDPGLLITGSAAGVILAYCIRFFAIAQSGIDAAFERITPNLGHAARSLGQGAGATLRRVYLPLMRGSLLTAGLLVFVDAAKELPATLLLRPFGFDTLATQIYDKASREDIAGATPAALMVICLSLIAVTIVARASQRK